MCIKKTNIAFALSFFLWNLALAQNGDCKVEAEKLNGQYSGECKKGYAHGSGEAVGIHKYIGEFEKGLPNGQGVYYISDSIFYEGSFLNGMREGQGKMTYAADSVLDGYWSGNIFQGDVYTKFSLSGTAIFDRYEITPSKRIGNTITIELRSTSGAPDGSSVNFRGGSGNTIRLMRLVSTNGVNLLRTREQKSSFSIISTYEISRFPVKLLGTLSNGEYFELELFRPASWKMSLFFNQ